MTISDGADGTPPRVELESAVFHRRLDYHFPRLAGADGINLIFEDGRTICDASGGPAVGSIGWGNKRVAEAVARAVQSVPYCATIFFTTSACEGLARELIVGTNGKMARAYILNSGSEAMEAAMKLARQYFLEVSPSQPQRTRFIGRNQSYHGVTLGALAIGGHKYRRANFEPMLVQTTSRVSPCCEYRGRLDGETTQQYVERLAKELDDEFQRVGPDTVCAFVAEPVVGAALGCVPSVDGYFQAMDSVCKKYGALLILDEVMCGMGRTGTLHAWEDLGVVPDIQTIGKGLGGGYQPVSAVLAGHRVVKAIENGTSAFVHGQTYQGHPVACAAALEVQRIIREENLLSNVRHMGALLSRRLKEELGEHPNVGDIRGRGLFWGIEFVANKTTKRPFPPELQVAMRMAELGLTEQYALGTYPANGSPEGERGDSIILAPPYNVTEVQVEMIVMTFARLVRDYFAKKIVI